MKGGAALQAPIRLTPTGIGLYAITSVLAIMATAGVSLIGRLLLAGAVTGVAMVIALLLRHLVTGLGSLAIVAVVIGVVRGAVLVTLLGALGAGGESPALRMVSSIVSALIWIVVIAVVLSSQEAYRVQISAAVREIAASRAAEGLDGLPEIASMKAAVGSAVADAGPDPDAASLRAAAALLREEIEGSIRPLSHRIWFGAGSPVPHTRLWPLVRDALFAFSVPIGAVLGVWGLSTLIGAPVLYGGERGIASAVLCTVFLGLVLLGARSAARRWRRRWLGPLLLILASVLPVAMTHAVLRDWGEAPSPIATFVLVPASIAALLLASAAVTLARADREEILAIARAHAVPSSAEVSSYLHNSLQSQLSALALQLDRAEPGSAEARGAVERLAAIASRSIADDFRAQRESPVDRLQEAARAWRGIAEVTVELHAVDGAHPRLPLVAQAVEEITSNAVRHGDASRVVVEVTEIGDDLVVEVHSNGAPALTRRGMGADWLASVARAPIVMEPTPDGSRLLVRM